MENNQETLRQIIKNSNLSLPYFTAYADFLERIESEQDLQQMFKEISTEEIEQCWEYIHEHYYEIDYKEVENELTFSEYESMTEHNFVHCITKDGQHVIHNLTTGSVLSKTSMKKFLKKYTLNDIDRVRLYCMFHESSRADDTFINDLRNLGIKWKPIKIKNPKRMLYRYPTIAA